MDRIQYVDVFRGIAILVMIFFHFIHTFAPVNVYADFPYYIADPGIFVFPPPPFLFLVVAGMSSYLLVTKRRSQGLEDLAIMKNVAQRYGFYVLISLPFTWFVFDLGTWLAWEEALQGIGLTIILLGILYVRHDITIHTGVGLMTVFALLQAHRDQLFTYIVQSLPVTDSWLLQDAGMLLWNATFGGFFAVTNLLPFAIGGLLMIKLLYEREEPQEALGLGLILTAVAGVLTGTGYSLGFYVRDLPLGFYGAGSAMLIYYAVYQLWDRYSDARVFDVLAAVGRVAFLVYVWSWILVIKTAESTGIAGTIGHGASSLLSAVITTGIVAGSVRYSAYRAENGPLLLLLKNKVSHVVAR
jgi:peptidoglycan/LPS O-acetylase OafA/YrhL